LRAPTASTKKSRCDICKVRRQSGGRVSQQKMHLESNTATSGIGKDLSNAKEPSKEKGAQPGPDGMASDRIIGVDGGVGARAVGRGPPRENATDQETAEHELGIRARDAWVERMNDWNVRSSSGGWREAGRTTSTSESTESTHNNPTSTMAPTMKLATGCAIPCFSRLLALDDLSSLCFLAALRARSMTQSAASSPNLVK
jgi:hypothetical protein